MNEINYTPPSMSRHEEQFVEHEENGIKTKTKTKEKITPITSFKGQLITQKILENMEKNSITTPSIVQKYVVPLGMHGKDLLISAPTGMGKTISFLVPTINFLNSVNVTERKVRGYADRGSLFKTPRKTVSALVLAPTRELAMQIHAEACILSEGMSITSACIYGGVEKKGQASSLSKGVDLLIGTPGRIQDFVFDQYHPLNLKNVQVLIFDEADRMLDMGFEKQIRSILGALSPNKRRQTMMFSATFPPAVQRLAKEFFQNTPEEVHVGNGPIESITQEIIYIEEPSKRQAKRNEKLMKILLEYGYKPSAAIEKKAFVQAKYTVPVLQWGDKHKNTSKQAQDSPGQKSGGSELPKIVIFVEKKDDCAVLSDYLHGNGINCTTLHGDKTQMEREYALKEFKGDVPILIATSIAARGLDVPGIALVLNYMMPNDVKEYIHRIGRTGRAGKTGRSITFFARDDHAQAAPLIEILKKAKQEVPEFLHEIAQMKSPKSHRGNSSRQSPSFKKREEGGQHFYETQEIKHKTAPALNEKIKIQKNLDWD
ncbi:ATP-dependent RNA helicase DDX3X [Nematocida sp. ERTm5]|nr:ATP-dependent RNA helicase DDX3X [Nematocida sp. AWRm79]KAI5183128.1 ATP-dependent RNA helicase DDX3X [Nematocida sp. AWRm78]OAG30771.1 ATP-dependent RNA helicase DDX3X [Nematocida sp. ERTm5]